MSGLFFDTNVVVYAHDPADPRKQVRAREVMHEAMIARRLVISSQVMQEFYHVAVRHQWMTPRQASEVLRLLSAYRVVPADAGSVLRSIELQQRYRLSIWDALIVQAAVDARCSALVSEDLQAGMRFESPAVPGSVLEVVNPFVDAAPNAAEPSARYRPGKAMAAGPRRSPGRARAAKA